MLTQAELSNFIYEISKNESNPFLDQIDFMIAGEQEVGSFNKEQADLYLSLIYEEFDEFSDAEEHSAESIKEAVDLLVVAIGYLLSLGINPQLVWNIVHENNMFKVTCPVKKDINGKIQKSEASIQKKKEMMDKLGELLHNESN